MVKELNTALRKPGQKGQNCWINRQNPSDRRGKCECLASKDATLVSLAKVALSHRERGRHAGFGWELAEHVFAVPSLNSREFREVLNSWEFSDGDFSAAARLISREVRCCFQPKFLDKFLCF